MFEMGYESNSFVTLGWINFYLRFNVWDGLWK